MSTTKKNGSKLSSTKISRDEIKDKKILRRESSKDRKDISKTEKSQIAKISKSSTSKLSTDRKPVESSRSSTLKLKPSTKQSTGSLQEENRRTNAPKRTSTKTAMPPMTPPSSRVKKTQYFPSKNLYTNALKSSTTTSLLNSSRSRFEEEGNIPKQEPRIARVSSRTNAVNTNQSKTNSQSRIAKKTVRDISPDTSSISERPRTATLRKGSIVNRNIVGPEAPKLNKNNLVANRKTPSPENSPNEESYEDDFESYESDFEQYSSSEKSDSADIPADDSSCISSSSTEEIALPKETEQIQKRVPSAGTDEERKMDSGSYEMPDYKRMHILEHIKESIERENANLTLHHHDNKYNPASLSDEGFEDLKSLQFINFTDAKKKCEHRKSVQLRKKRGEEILSMIKLDAVSYTLFELQPVPYDVFIKTFGNQDCLQVSVQTGEDDVSEETQTDYVEHENKWTQNPVAFTEFNPSIEGFWDIYKSEYLGVGRDENRKRNTDLKDVVIGTRFEKFIVTAGNLILNVIAEESIGNFENLRKNSRDIPFSAGYVLLNTSNDLLLDSSLTNISVSSHNPNKLLTIHKKPNGDIKSILCIWDIYNINEPQSVLISYGEVTCSSFALYTTDFIFTGQKDGAIAVWDMRRKSAIESPTYITELGMGHEFSIVGIQPYKDTEDKALKFNSTNQQLHEICSLDEDGMLIFWSLFPEIPNNKIRGKHITLLKIDTVALKSLHPQLTDLRCTDLVISSSNTTFAYISTNYGLILHHVICDGKTGKTLVPEFTCEAICLETCPFSQDYILAGYADGNISLYSRRVEKALMMFSNKEDTDNNTIDLIRWSKNQPFVVYARDSKNIIHVWNLKQSDMYPLYSIPFEEIITCFQLSPSLYAQDDHIRGVSYMVMGTENGKIYLHVLNSDHGVQPLKMHKNDVNMFLDYVSRL